MLGYAPWQINCILSATLPKIMKVFHYLSLGNYFLGFSQITWLARLKPIPTDGFPNKLNIYFKNRFYFK